MSEKTGQHVCRSGFSLVELVITMLILGILGAAAAPRYFEAISRFRVEAAAKRVAADLELARQNAKAINASQEVTYMASSEKYALPGMADPNHPENNYLVDLARTAYPADLVSVSFGEFGADNRIHFDMYGRPDYGGNVVVAVASHQRTVTVSDKTGKVTISP